LSVGARFRGSMGAMARVQLTPSAATDGTAGVHPPTAADAARGKADITQYIADEQKAIAARGLKQKPDSQSFALFHDDPAVLADWRDRIGRYLAGLLTTASNLIFSGDSEGNLLALDSRSGKLLWKTNAGGDIAMGPMTYQVNGKQYVAFSAGSSLFVYALK